ncbi:MAG: IS21 family transposase [bacterium]
MTVTDQQVRKLLMEYQKTGVIGTAAMMAGMNRKTAAGYVESGRLPSERKTGRDWRTKPNPFEGCWPEVEAKLREAPELEAKALFEWLAERHPGQFQEGQVRTLQRHVRQWRVLHGPDKEVYFPQDHKPGVRLSTDFTCMNGLEVTILGERFNHLLCHSVLSHSNWEWGVICHSESLLSLRRGLQAALLQLGHVPREHWTDHSTAATHGVGADRDGCRDFNLGYLDVMRHFGIAPRTTQVREPHENGDVESANGAFKRRVRQHLLLRGNSDFDSLDGYRYFLEGIFHKVNRLRSARFAEELAAMRPLGDVPMLPEYSEAKTHVSKWSMIQSDRKSYSVPSRLIGQTVRVRRYEDRLEVYVAGILQVSMPRLTGEKTHAVNYRHLIGWLMRKPGAFAGYRFRCDLFPSLVFRRAYDRLCGSVPQRTADQEYLRILRQAAVTMESDVERVLADLEGKGLTPRWDVLAGFWPKPAAELPELRPLRVELEGYDGLIWGREVPA